MICMNCLCGHSRPKLQLIAPPFSYESRKTNQPTNQTNQPSCCCSTNLVIPNYLSSGGPPHVPARYCIIVHNAHIARPFGRRARVRIPCCALGWRKTTTTASSSRWRMKLDLRKMSRNLGRRW